MLAVQLEAQRMWRIRDLSKAIQEMERRGEYADQFKEHLEFLKRDGFGEKVRYLAMYEVASRQHI